MLSRLSLAQQFRSRFCWNLGSPVMIVSYCILAPKMEVEDTNLSLKPVCRQMGMIMRTDGSFSDVMHVMMGRRVTAHKNCVVIALEFSLNRC